MITAVDLLRGIAALVGWDRIEVPGATGYLDTDYAAKGRAARRGSRQVRYRVRPRRGVRRGLARRPLRREGEGDRGDRPAHRRPAARRPSQTHGDWRIMISPDHPTFLRTKVHTHGNVPVAMAGTGIAADEFTSLRRHERGQLEAGVRRRLEGDAVVYRKEVNHRDHRGHGARYRLPSICSPCPLCPPWLTLQSKITRNR